MQLRLPLRNQIIIYYYHERELQVYMCTCVVLIVAKSLLGGIHLWHLQAASPIERKYYLERCRDSKRGDSKDTDSICRKITQRIT